MWSLYSSYAIFLFAYTAMLWFVFVWAILAAIINPSLYLPYTAAALTLVGTIIAKYVGIQTKYNNITKALHVIIE